MASVDIPSAKSWRMLLPESRVMGTSAPGVGGIVVLHCQGGGGMMPSGSVVGRRKCLQMGHVTDVEVWPCTALMFPWAM